MSDTIVKPVSLFGEAVPMTNTSLVPAASLSPTVQAGGKVLTADEQSKVLSIKNQINVSDSNAVLTYGISAQQDITSFAEGMMSKVKSKDAGHVGETLTDLMVKVKDLDAGNLGSNSMSKIPFFGQFFDAIRRFMAKYENISSQIDKIVKELDAARGNLLQDIQSMDQMYIKNLDYLKNLDLFIAAGEEKLAELTATTLVELKNIAEQTQTPEDVQKYNDFSQFLNRFEKKLHDLKLSRMIAVQTGPQVRLIQSGDQVLVEKIQSSILTTIPLWKSQIVIAIALFRQQKAVELQKNVTDTTNSLLLKNSQLLKDNSIAIAKETERGIVEIETLKKVNNDLITTIDEVLKIQAEGKIKRQQATVELAKLEGELKQKMLTTVK
jgi:uncharacterized protein YaaN involved in tellurite resistance